MPKRPETLSVGSVLGFETRFPDQEGSTGRFSAVKAIGVDTWGQPVVAALDLVTTEMPTLQQAGQAAVLLRHRFSFRGQPAVLAVQHLVREDEAILTSLGGVQPSEEELGLAAKCMSMSVIETVCAEAELEWRWRHDRQGLVEHFEREREARESAARVATESRRAELSLDLLASEVAFKGWEPSPPFPGQEFRDAASNRVRELARTLIDMGPDLDESAVRSVLHDGVLWFNHADQDAGHPIETVEREDIVVVFQELAAAVGHPDAASVIDGRTW